MKNKKRNRMVAFILTIMLALSFTTPTFAATYTQGNQTLNIQNGRAILTVDGYNYQLSKAGVTDDGVIAPDGTVYLLWKNSGNLYFYSHKYQKGDIKRIFVATAVMSIDESGYDTSKGHYNFLTDEEIRTKLGIGNNSSNNNNTGGNNSSSNNNTGNNNNVGAYKLDSTTVLYNDGKNNTYIVSQGQNVDTVVNKSDVVYIRFVNGNLKYWKISEKVLKTLATGTRGLVENNGTVTGYYDSNGVVKALEYSTPTSSATQFYASLQNGQVIASRWENTQLVETYILNIKDATWASVDSIGTVYIRNKNGYLYIWNYDIQKANTNPVRIESNVENPIISGGKIIGYTKKGSQIMQQTWSLDQIKVAVVMSANNTTNQDTKTNTEKPKVKTKNSYRVLYDEKGDKINQYRLINGTLYINGKKIKNVQKAGFTKSYNIAYIKGGKLYIIDKTTLVSKYVLSKASHFKHDSNGFATYVIKKNKSKKKIS